ncbi:MAG TPA: LLM class flavin-dependent oxidoreductase [Candidatus Methylomirabilis sp.]|nr:LLM class flavin-dependent oxidoreductase [Candidatus Methylomirabilis sp.]
MDFGLFVPCHRFDASLSTRELYDQALETVKLADEAGFTTAWFPEHHLVQYYSSPSPLMWMVKAAAATRRIRVGAAILVIPYYNPLRLAGELGMADVLCDGRLEIGVGRGAFEYEFDRFGITEAIGAARLREGMEIVEGLLTQDDFSYEGVTCSFGPATAVPKPLQQPHPPIWVAARSADTIEWAIRRGYNLLTTPWRDPFSRIAAHHEQVRKIAASVGAAKPPVLAVSRMTYVGASDGDALEAMADIQVSHRIFMRLFRNEASVKGGFTLAEPVDDEYTREQLLANLVAGSPETCIAKLREYEALGIGQFIIYGAFGPDHARTMASLRRFAEHVMPHFRKGPRS